MMRFSKSVYIIILICVTLLFQLAFSANIVSYLLVVSSAIFLFLYVLIPGLGLIKNPGYAYFMVYSSVRYLILPTVLIISKSYGGDDLYLHGVLLFIAEETTVGIFLVIFSKTLYCEVKDIEKISMPTTRHPESYNVVFLIIVVITIVIITFNPVYLTTYNTIFDIFNRNIVISKYGDGAVGIVSIFLEISRLVLPILLVQKIIGKYYEQRQTWHYLLVVFITFFSSVIIFSGTSRNSAIIPGIATMFFLLKVFEDKRKITLIISGVVLISVLIFLTLFKNNITGRSISDMKSLAYYLDAYVSGPQNVATSMLTYKNHSQAASLSLLLNDLFYNVPGLSRFFDSEFRTTVFHNIQVYGRGSQRDIIIPTIGQGLFYLGPYFCVLLQPAILFIAVIFDRKFHKSKSLIELFLYGYLAVRVSGYAIHNLSLAVGMLLGTALPLLLLVYLNKRIFKRESNREKV